MDTPEFNQYGRSRTEIGSVYQYDTESLPDGLTQLEELPT